jgi:hypothetical protein
MSLMLSRVIPAPATLPALGAHTLLGQPDSSGANPGVTPAINTESGSALIVFLSGYTSNSGPPTDTYANTWPLDSSQFYLPYGTAFQVRAYAKINAAGGNGHQITFNKIDVPAGELTIPFIEVRNVSSIAQRTLNYVNQGSPLTSNAVTTTGPAVLVAAWWGDAGSQNHTAVPNNGFTVIDSYLALPASLGVQCAIAYREVSSAGTYDVTWTETPDQGAALWLFALQ